MCNPEQVPTQLSRQALQRITRLTTAWVCLLVAALVAVACTTTVPVSLEPSAADQAGDSIQSPPATEPTPIPEQGSASEPPAAANPAEDPRDSDVRLPLGTPDPVWMACPGGECTTVTVPLDYDDPNGATIEVAVTRGGARDIENRIGALFINFGGPGGETNEVLGFAATVFADVFPRFDIIGWDPRGIGETARLACDQLGSEFALIELDPSDGFDDEIAQQEADFADIVDCANASGPIIDHLGTANVARDMNQVRIALGEEQMNYLGYSYGTQIGWVYATLFGDTVRAMVLDGAVPGGSIGSEDFVDQLASFQRTFDHFDDVCDRAPDCALSSEGLREGVARVAAILRDNPVSLRNGQQFGEAELLEAVIGAMYSPAFDSGPPLSQAILDAANGDVVSLEAIRTSGNSSSTPGGYQAVLCADGGQFPGPDGVAADFAETYAVSETFGLLGETIRCDLWPGAIEGLPTLDTSAAPTLLVVGSTLDPATPYEDAVLLDQQLANSVLVTVEASGHTAVVGDRCATDYAVDYLNDLVAPPEGAVCEVLGVVGVEIVDNDGGVEVIAVSPGSAAEETGIVPGDIIVSVDGTTLNVTADFPLLPADVALEWVVLRDGADIAFTVAARRPPWF